MLDTHSRQVCVHCAPKTPATPIQASHANSVRVVTITPRVLRHSQLICADCVCSTLVPSLARMASYPVSAVWELCLSGQSASSVLLAITAKTNTCRHYTLFSQHQQQDPARHLTVSATPGISSTQPPQCARSGRSIHTALVISS